MSKIRNVALVTLVTGFLLCGQGSLLAFYPEPPFYGCDDGCTCGVDYYNWGHVTGACPDTAGAEECDFAFESCYDYCLALGPWIHDIFPQQNPRCWIGNFGGEGCDPEGLEPPTNWNCECWCSED